jgi:branched-chain amino acid aminotransferase
MTALANERVAYFNGRIVPESEVLIPFRDRGFIFGDAVFDTARTFNHKPFRLQEHVERLQRSLRYLQIDSGHSVDELIAISEEVLAKNLHLIDDDEDYWLTQRVSRGLNAADRLASDAPAPTVIVECTPLPLKARAKLFRDGIEVVTPSVRRVSPTMVSPQAKTHNYLNLILGDLEVRAQNPDAWAVLLDENGNLAEGLGSNIFTVHDGAILTPKQRFVLPGVSRQTVLDLARKIGIPTVEKGGDLFDAYTADEAFLTSTSLCICPVRTINGRTFASGQVPGPITKRLTEAYVELVGCDFVGQYLRRLDS